MRTRLLTLLAAAALLLAGCGSSTNEGAPPTTTPTPTTTIPPTTAGPTTATTAAEPTTTPTTPAPTTSTTCGCDTAAPAPSTTDGSMLDLRVYYLLGEHLAVVHRQVPHTVSTSKAALLSLLEGPTAADRANGLSTAIPSGTQLLGVDLRNDGVLVVDLTTPFVSGGGSASMMARVAQVVFTGTQYPVVRAVSLRVNGKDLTALGGEGLLLGKPQTRADWEAVSGPIVLETPGVGQTVRSPLAIAGESNTFEADVQVEVVGANGQSLLRDHFMATSGTGTWGTFAQTLRFRGAPGPITLKLWDEGGASPGEGPPPIVVAYPLTLAS